MVGKVTGSGSETMVQVKMPIAHWVAVGAVIVAVVGSHFAQDVSIHANSREIEHQKDTMTEIKKEIAASIERERKDSERLVRIEAAVTNR